MESLYAKLPNKQKLTETRRTPRIRAGEAQTSAASHVPEGKQVTSLLNSWHGMLHVDEGHKLLERTLDLLKRCT